MMSEIVLIGIGMVSGIVIYITLSRLFSGSNKSRPNYGPLGIGKFGYRRVSTSGYHGVIIVEEVDRIDNLNGQSKVKIRVVESFLDLDSDKNEGDLLRKWGGNIWSSPNDFTWDAKSLAEIRQERIDSLVGESD